MAKIDYTLTGLDEEGNAVVEIELTQEVIGEILLTLIERGVALFVPTKKDVGLTPTVRGSSSGSTGGTQKRGASKKTPTCRICGLPGHNAKTCTKKEREQVPAPRPPKETAAAPDRPDWKTVRARELLLEGKDIAQVAEVIDSSEQVVNFIRKGMISRGELK